MEEKSNALSPLHPRILNVDTADGGDYLNTQLNVSAVTEVNCPHRHSRRTSTPQPVIRNDSSTTNSKSGSAILTSCRATTPRVLTCRAASVCAVISGGCHTLTHRWIPANAACAGLPVSAEMYAERLCGCHSRRRLAGRAYVSRMRVRAGGASGMGAASMAINIGRRGNALRSRRLPPASCAPGMCGPPWLCRSCGLVHGDGTVSRPIGSLTLRRRGPGS